MKEENFRDVPVRSIKIALQAESIVGWRGGRNGPQLTGTDIFVSLALGIDLRVNASLESRLSAIRIRQRLCDKLTVKKVCLKNVSSLDFREQEIIEPYNDVFHFQITYDELTSWFIQQMLNHCAYESVHIEMSNIDQFHPRYEVLEKVIVILVVTERTL